MSKKLMIVYGLLVMFLFYSLFITYVILAEPPRLSLEDALIWPAKGNIEDLFIKLAKDDG